MKRISWILFFLTLHVGVPAREAADDLRAGAAAVDITPDFPVALAGYSDAENRISEGVHDRIFARAVAFESGSKRLVLVSCDVSGFAYAPISFFQKSLLGRFKLQPDELYLCGTHTHSAPMVILNKSYPHPNNYRYAEMLRDKLQEAVERALGALHPARIGVGHGSSPVGANRRLYNPGTGRTEMARNPEGPVDSEVLVLQATGLDGSPVAAMFDYACHSRSLNSQNKLISGDIFGIAQQFVERTLGRRMVCAAFAGASGDIDPWYVMPGFSRDPGWPSETELMGTLLGEEVVHVLRDIRDFAAQGVIRTAGERIALPGKSAGRSTSASDRTKFIEVSAARIGEVGLVAVDCEMLVELGKAIKASSPFRYTFILTHCNGGSGYLPPAHAYTEGGYEVNLTGFAPEAADMVVKHAVRMLQNVQE